MIRLCTEVDWQSLNKYGEELCGDKVEVATPNDSSTVVVLADGLGSGVKANILSTLTSKVISTMVANDLPLNECVAAIAATLPVCSVREIAYSTFTILRIDNNESAQIIQYDNPMAILLRDGRHNEFPYVEQTIEGKTIYTSNLQLKEGDVFITVSDGVEHAGAGLKMNFDWLRKDIIRYMESIYRPEYTAHTLTGVLIDKCERLYEGKPSDDATVCTLKVRRRTPVSMLIGPPENPADINKVMDLFFAKAGRHIVCGGTTAGLAAEYLGKEIAATLPSRGDDPEIPPISIIEGIDLVTEGVITISRVLHYSQQYLMDDWNYYDARTKNDGASRIATMLFEEATDITFFVGKAINPAHQNPNLPINFSIKMQLVQELLKNLEKMGKRVKASFF